MTVLLDTHTFIWFNLSDPSLTSAARRTIENAANRVLISPASYWEIAIKISKGKFTIGASYEDFWRRGIDELDIEVLPVKIRHTAQLIAMPFHHKDPFDRLLIAQALAENIPLVSADAHFDAYGVQRLW